MLRLTEARIARCTPPVAGSRHRHADRGWSPLGLSFGRRAVAQDEEKVDVAVWPVFAAGT